MGKARTVTLGIMLNPVTFMGLLSLAVIVSSAFSNDDHLLSRQKRQDGFVPWIENNCNGSIVSTSVQTGKLHTNTYPRAYLAGVCHWRVTVPQNMVVMVRLQFLYCTCYRDDMLRVVDGDGFVHIDDACGYQGQSSFYTFTNSFDVIFTATANNKVRNGFLIYYVARTKDVAMEQSDPCTGYGKLLEAASGSQMSPGYKDDGTGLYDNSLECKWTIKVGWGDNILLRFDSFHLEYYSDCRYDWVKIYNADDTAGRLFSVNCGSGAIPDIKTTSNTMLISFKSDSSAQANGFKFSWETLQASTRNDQTEPGCGLGHNEVTGTSGVITSPFYGQPYPAQSYCTHIITVGRGRVVEMLITHMDIEPGFDCLYDSLAIFNGPAPNYTMLSSDDLCGTEIPILPLSTYNAVSMVFLSDNTRQFTGFRIEWKEAGKNDFEGLPCVLPGQTWRTLEGTIESPEFGKGDYPNKADCRWMIQAPIGGQIILSWRSSDIESEATCRYDYLKIYDGPTSAATLLRTICGNDIPDDLKSSGEDLFLQLKTDASITKEGFSLSFKALAPVEGGVYPNCGGEPTKLTVPNTWFTSPGFTGSDPYASNLNCEWLITASPRTHVTIMFESMDIEDFKGCSADKIKVYAGASANRSVSKIHCGMKTNFEVYVRSSQVLVVFTSDATVGGNGFRATWMETTPKPEACGIPHPRFPVWDKDNTNEIANRIYGGSDAYPHSLPWQIFIQKLSIGFSCGGSIISPEWILTAAHCLTKGTLVSIVAGAHDRYKAEDNQQVRLIVDQVIHPGYLNWDMDFAMLRLDEPLVFNDYVQPICLAKEGVTAGTECLTSGWGKVEAGYAAPRLRQVYLPIINKEDCRTSLGPAFTDNMLCAGFPEGKLDACSGDSGGPFACLTSSGSWELQGVTSWGYGCGLAGKPGVWARVTNVHAWVQQVTDNQARVVN